MSILLDGHSIEEKDKQLLLSLIAIFDSILPTVCYKRAEKPVVLSTMNAKGKQTADIIRMETAGKKARTGDSAANTAFSLLDAYFQYIFYDNAQTKITVREIWETDWLPPAVKLSLEQKIVTSDRIFFVYIHEAKWCISQLMNAVKHRHHSNNACAVAVFVDDRMDIYACCYCCKSPVYAKLATFDGKTKMLPSLKSKDAFLRVIYSPCGIDCHTHIHTHTHTHTNTHILSLSLPGNSLHVWDRIYINICKHIYIIAHI